MSIIRLRSRFSFFFAVARRATLLWGGALSDEPKNGCVGDYSNMKVSNELLIDFLPTNLSEERDR